MCFIVSIPKAGMQKAWCTHPLLWFVDVCCKGHSMMHKTQKFRWVPSKKEIFQNILLAKFNLTMQSTAQKFNQIYFFCILSFYSHENWCDSSLSKVPEEKYRKRKKDEMKSKILLCYWFTLLWMWIVTFLFTYWGIKLHLNNYPQE